MIASRQTGNKPLSERMMAYVGDACMRHSESTSHRQSTHCGLVMPYGIIQLNWFSMGLLPDSNIAGCACARNAGNVFPHRRLQRKPLVSDPGMHHGTCVTHVSWCMSGSLTRLAWKTFPAFPAHAQTSILRIWQEAHWLRWIVAWWHRAIAWTYVDFSSVRYSQVQ